MAKRAAEALPAMKAGRPVSMRAEKREEALDLISGLYRRGVSFEVAKQRAAMRYECSLRTIEDSINTPIRLEPDTS